MVFYTHAYHPGSRLRVRRTHLGPAGFATDADKDSFDGRPQYARHRTKDTHEGTMWVKYGH